MKTRPDNLGQVRDALVEMYVDVMNDHRKCAQVHEGANALGKAINACKIYLEYTHGTGVQPSDEWHRFITGQETVKGRVTGKKQRVLPTK